MKIKIEKMALLENAPFFAGVAILTFFFIWQSRLSSSLRQELDTKTREFKNAEAASSRLIDLERQIDEIKQEEELLHKKVAINEKEPLALLKMLIRLGGDAGLREIDLNLREKTVSEQLEVYQNTQIRAEPVEGATEEAASQPAASVSEAGSLQQVVLQEAGASPIYLEMNFEGSFPQMLTFLNRLMHLERIIKVDSMLIERKKEILPYQKVSLGLVAYTFLE